MSSKNQLIHVRLTEQEKEVLEKVSELSGQSQGDVIRNIISFAGQMVATDESAKVISRNENLKVYFNKFFHDVRPYDVARILVMLGALAADNGRMAEYEKIVELAYGKPNTIAPAVIDTLRDHTQNANA